ncbi:hypothetical protein EPA93_36535 [Ktedonosporobacter rubrisoli]|uniref:Uncharacterized protein n=1 Tax=Ktedonosporobacter rubrisoli TaxID=2509675 RepID=A0A4P6K0N2_KTERU|nr:hypothetical protein [Ktedonosporobacter rubrisoli]QBD81190.1 hypothetical protein EPA93_36535 [Ktedonosporobacter rubrisoli]
MQQEQNEPVSAQSELSETWQELLGILPKGKHPTAPQVSPNNGETPALQEDPWNSLVHAKGIEVVDLQQLHLHMSDQDVEQVLDKMREQPAQDTDDASGSDH